jgi:hypothetical protein
VESQALGVAEPPEAARGRSGGGTGSEGRMVRVVAQRLAAEFELAGGADQLEALVEVELARWRDVRVTQFVGILAERHLRDQLRASTAPVRAV